MDYSKTVNKPKTNFSMKANLKTLEKNMLTKWQSVDVYKKMLQKNIDSEMFILHDGPPYANGKIHIGHALNKILKDFVIKNKFISGYNSPYVPGWDCHGLPIEFQLLKEMNKTKYDVNVLEFRKEAKKFALKYKDIQKEEFIRLGVFGDWENPYLTLSEEFEKNIISVFSELILKGYIYKGKKPVYSCIYCETALAEAEVEYSDHSSDSVYVKFPVLEFPENLEVPENVPGTSKNSKISVIIWTTTPWTLPANLAIAFGKDFDYVFAKFGNEIFIVAKERLSFLEEVLNSKAEILKKIKGYELKGILVSAPFLNTKSTGVLADFVSLEDGTGIVHIAPGHGEDDYYVGIHNALKIFSPVNIRGRFTEEVKEFEGENVFKANEKIIENLKNRSLLISNSKITHSYPHCWRCKKPVIFRATEQWFLDVDKLNLRERLIKAAEEVNWIPEVGKNRIISMLSVRPDWCLSRQRLWGTPIPVIYCDKCTEPLIDRKIFDKIIALFAVHGSDIWFEKDATFFLPENYKCKCGNSKDFSKDTNILDVWFDSGVSSFAVLKERKNLGYPADLYLEGSDQARGWFQTSLIPSVCLEERAPYKNCLTHGFTVDGEGKKMSKSIGNVVAPQEIIEKYGAEIVRLWVASCDYTEDIRISETIISQLVDAYRKIRNTVRYMLGNIDDFSENQRVEFEKLSETDKWILVKFEFLLNDIKKSYEDYKFYQVYRMIYNFCTIELSSLYFDISKDKLYTYSVESMERKSVQTALNEMLKRLVIVIAPVLSFTAEEIYENIKGEKKETIFLESFPEIREKFLDNQIISKWEKILKLRNLANLAIEKLRQKGEIGNSVEAKLIFFTGEGEYSDLIKEMSKDLAAICIVSEIEINNIYEKDKIIPADAVTDENIKNVAILSMKTENKKCSRCWIHHKTTGKIEKYPDLCQKCADIVDKISNVQ